MSYIRKIEYRINPKNSYEIYKNCSGCGCKTKFYNTNCFRVNANGNKIDIWLIYQCKKCKHTYNLTIYERKDPQSISKYEEFLSNSPTLAFEYGTDITLFLNNRVEIDRESLKYELEIMNHSDERNTLTYGKGDTILIHNDYCLKIRIDKILSNILNISRNRIKQLIKSNIISVEEMNYGLKFKINIQEEL